MKKFENNNNFVKLNLDKYTFLLIFGMVIICL